MNTTKLLTMLMAALVVSAGAGAVTAQSAETTGETSVDASYDDGTVTVTVTQNDTGVENVSVEANGEAVGETDANGTLTFETNASEELELELDGENVDLEREYAIEDGELVRESDDEEDDDESELAADVSYDNGTVDVTVTQNGSAVENASVAANGEDVGATDANGSLTFETNTTEELEIEVESGEQELEREYAIEDGELVPEDEEDDAAELAADVSYDNGTVDVTVTQNGSAVENASVAANGEDVGTTDANGTLTFETNATEELELAITAGEQTLELSYTIEDGELVRESDDEESAGPDENASERAHSVFAVIQSWLDGDSDQSLGQLIQEQLGNGNDGAPGNSGNASDRGNGNDGAPGNSGNGDDAPGNSGDAPGHADDGDDAESEEDEADEEDEDEEEDEEDEDDDRDAPGNSGNANGNGNGNN